MDLLIKVVRFVPPEEQGPLQFPIRKSICKKRFWENILVNYQSFNLQIDFVSVPFNIIVSLEENHSQPA